MNDTMRRVHFTRVVLVTVLMSMTIFTSPTAAQAQAGAPVPAHAATLVATPVATPMPEQTATPFHFLKSQELPFQKGVNVVINGDDTTMGINSDGMLADLVRRNLGVNSLMVTSFFCQDGVEGTNVFLDPVRSLSVAHMQDFIESAHAHGFKYVWVRFLIDEGCLNGSWRGALRPGGGTTNVTALTAWFNSYENTMAGFARMLEKEGVTGLMIGTELASLDQNTKTLRGLWKHLIDDIRMMYDGVLAYAMNWTPAVLPAMAQDVDVLTIDAYFELLKLPDHATADQIYLAEKMWTPIIQGLINQLPKTTTVMFSETGIAPITGAYRQPWRAIQGPLDYEAQSNYYQAMCKYVSQDLKLAGNFWWAIGFYDWMQNQYGRATYNFYDTMTEDTVRVCNSN